MITVIKAAKTLNDGIKNMMEAAKEDYKKFSTNKEGVICDYSKNVLENWEVSVKTKVGKKFIKVIKDNSVFAFVCLDAVSAPFYSYKVGDILKPASWNRPSLNAARGNVLTGGYGIEWTGPLYLR